ncbi:GDSL-type esterase/lipase family protein [Schaalia canis]|nr:GDSL-type esterase/lipase family protein [Schaalia canis]
MFKITTRFLAGVATVATAMGAFSLPAHADDSGKYLTVTLIGDSYTAGNGAGAYYGPKGSYRSTRNWGHTYVNWLNSQGVHTTVHNLAESGAVTKNVLEKQIPALDPTTDVVMLTIGGNDIKFEDIVKGCFAGPISSINKCAKAMKFAKDTFPSTRENIVEVLRQVQAKVAEDSQIILVGYPLLSMDKDWHVQPGWFSPGKPYPAAREVRQFGQFATQEQQKLVDEWNTNPANKVKITFVPTELHFTGHEPDPDENKRNPLRWLNEFIEDEGQMGPNGEIISKGTGWFDYASWYHPNITGHAEIAKLLQQKIGIPSNVRSVRNPKRDSDIVFVVETSTATAEKLDQIKKQIRRVVDEATRTATDAGKEARFSLVTFRDLPVAPPAPAPGAEATPGAEGTPGADANPGAATPEATPGATPAAPAEAEAPAANAAPAPRTVAGFRSVSAFRSATTAEDLEEAAQPVEAEATVTSTEESDETDDLVGTPLVVSGDAATGNTNDTPTPGAPGATDTAADATVTSDTNTAGNADKPAENAQPAPAAPLEEVMVLSEFTADRDAFLALVDGLEANGEAGGPAVYNALKKAIAMPFTAGARKRVLLLGDGELADNDANNALDWAALAQDAFTANTAEILVLDPDNETSPALTNLSHTTGGHVTALETVRPLIIDPPTARISSVDVLAVGEEFVLDASGSFAAEGSIMKYEWDVDGDGTYDLTSEAPAGEAANPLQGHRYAAPFTGNVAVRVTDKFGHTAVGTVEVTVTKDGDLIDDAQDNCPADRNPEQIDTDKDGIGDACDDTPLGVPSVPVPPTTDPAPGGNNPGNNNPGGNSGSQPAPGGKPQVTPTPDGKPQDDAKSQGDTKPQGGVKPQDNASSQTPKTDNPKASQETFHPKSSAPKAGLAKTGMDAGLMAGAGALLVVGGFMVARTRRR